MIRYRCQDLPTVGHGAFTPIATTNAPASSYGLVKITALLGLKPIPSPKPTAVPPISAIDQTQSSYVAPDYILRDQYVAYADNMGPAADAGIGMARRRLTPIPVPALSWINTALNAMAGSKIGGRGVTAWPRAFQRWPTIGSQR